MIKKILLLLCFSSTLGILSQEKSVNKLVASQNPYNSITNISFNSTNKQKVQVSVKNVIGKTVFSKEFIAEEGKNTIRCNRGNLKTGIYIYAIQTNNEIISKRFVIE